VLLNINPLLVIWLSNKALWNNSFLIIFLKFCIPFYLNFYDISKGNLKFKKLSFIIIISAIPKSMKTLFKLSYLVFFLIKVDRD